MAPQLIAEVSSITSPRPTVPLATIVVVMPLEIIVAPTIVNRIFAVSTVLSMKTGKLPTRVVVANIAKSKGVPILT
uniref:Uncharacterized protein n=1 Tax=Panagrellus redivivus TaxID=6233 RepID=A0A7E4W1M7_PANRE